MGGARTAAVRSTFDAVGQAARDRWDGVRRRATARGRTTAPPSAAWREARYRGPAGDRPYALYRPAHVGAGAPLLVLLHGCTQDPADLAMGTGMHRLAEQHGFVVAYPQQLRTHNPRRCWNWFRDDDQRRGTGEPAIIAGIAREVATAAASDPRRIYVAGLSAGGAMAGVLAATYPDVFAAVGIHSGLAYRAATDVRSAVAVMRGDGVGGDPSLHDPATADARAVLDAMGRRARAVPVVVVHGTDDHTVAASNGDRVVHQWLGVDRRLARGHFSGRVGRPHVRHVRAADGGHAAVVTRWRRRRTVVVEQWRIDDLGHAWSGGTAGGSYTDPRGPDASEAIWSFLARHRL